MNPIIIAYTYGFSFTKPTTIEKTRNMQKGFPIGSVHKIYNIAKGLHYIPLIGIIAGIAETILIFKVKAKTPYKIGVICRLAITAICPIRLLFLAPLDLVGTWVYNVAIRKNGGMPIWENKLLDL